MKLIKFLFILFLCFLSISCAHSLLSSEQLEKKLYSLTPINEDVNTVKSKLFEKYGSNAIVGFGLAKSINSEWHREGWYSDI